ncbi:MAG TPA: hypothetical protein VGB69_09105 [Edaphobacter sp.]
MSIRLPSARITPTDVIEFCKKRGQKPTIEEAERWLSLVRRDIAELMDEVIKEHLEEILDQASVHSYPDPEFDKQYRAIDDAILTATENYSVQIGGEHYGSSHTDKEMIEVVSRMLSPHKKFVVCMEYSNDFGMATKNFDDKEITHSTKRVHITSENGNIVAELIENEQCKHEDDVFMPEKLHSLN